MAIFPTSGWFETLHEKLNSDTRYAQIAANWEGDMRFVIEPSGLLTETVSAYLDLWHGKCKDAFIENNPEERSPAFVLKASYENFARIVTGQLDPMQALMTRKLGVQGNMAVIMRSVPTVLDFVRCCREITTGVL
jgi:putative sterol carrier protein